MAEVKDYLKQQEEERRVGVGVDVSPKARPVVLLGDENVPVAVVFDELRSAQ